MKFYSNKSLEETIGFLKFKTIPYEFDWKSIYWYPAEDYPLKHKDLLKSQKYLAELDLKENGKFRLSLKHHKNSIFQTCTYNSVQSFYGNIYSKGTETVINGKILLDDRWIKAMAFYMVMITILFRENILINLGIIAAVFSIRTIINFAIFRGMKKSYERFFIEILECAKDSIS